VLQIFIKRDKNKMNANSKFDDQKIIIIDNVITGNNHLVINSGIINMAQNLFRFNAIKKEILFFGERHHMSILANLIDTNDACKVAFLPIEVIDPKVGIIKNTISWVGKLINDKKNVDELFDIISFQKPKLIIVSNMMPINMNSFIGMMNRKLNQNVLIFLHGEVELLFNQKKSLKGKINKYFLEKSLKKICSNTKFIVFGDYVKKRLIEKFNINYNQIISINHPILKYERNTFEISERITFSHIGVANKRKNSGLIFKLANAFDETIKKDICRFSIIGRIDGSELEYISGNVMVESKGKQPIPNDKYIELITKSDYSLIFLLDEEYVYRMSGSLLDSIQFQIPIIALKHVFVSELFDKGGDIGFLCNDFEEMQEVVHQIVLKNPKFINRYNLQVLNLKKLAEQFYPEQAAAIIKNEIDVCERSY
jgi:hypothetical protein